MAYNVCVNVEDMQLIMASMIGCVRRMQMGTGPEKDKISFTTAVAECITRLNQGELHDIDVEFINTCLQKTLNLVHVDAKVPQKAVVVMKLEALQNKLRGGVRAPALVMQ
jgi:hypothetical protein